MFKKLFTIFIIFSSLFFSLNFCLAEDEPFENVEVEKLQAKASHLNPVDINSPQELIGRLIKAMLAPIGALSLLWVVVAGVMWMTAAGNPEKIKKASNILLWSGLGVMAILSSYLIVTAVFNFLT